MGAFSIWHWLIVLVVVLVLFGGRGKISGLMGDLGKGLKAFKSNIKEDEKPSSDVSAQVAHQPDTENATKGDSSGSETSGVDSSGDQKQNP